MSEILSTHFALSEFTRSDTARKANIVNEPPECLPLLFENAQYRFCAAYFTAIPLKLGDNARLGGDICLQSPDAFLNFRADRAAVVHCPTVACW